MPNQLIKKTVIITGYICNNRCQFCIDDDKRDLKEKSTAEIKQEMYLARERGTTYLELIGGEVFIRPDIISLLKLAKKIGFATISIATNGRMLGYIDFAQSVVAAGLTDIIFSLHGHTRELHDGLTQSPGSFDELLKGVKNMKDLLGLEHMGTNTTIVKQNIKQLKDIGELIYSSGIRNSEFIFVDPSYGAAFNNFHKFVPKISMAAPFIHNCLKIGQRGDVRHWHIRYVPLCYFTDYLDQVSELLEIRIFQSEHIAPDFQNYDVETSRKEIGRAKTKRCQNCRLFDKCEGIWQEYLRQYGDEELSKVK